MRIKSRAFWKKAGVICFWLLVWELTAVCLNNKVLLVTPVDAILTLVNMLGKAVFWKSVGASLAKISLGFFLGALFGVLAACAAHRYSVADELLKPVVACMKAVPVVCFVVLLLLWFGAGMLSVTVSFLMVFPNLYISLLEGLRAVPKPLLEMKKMYRLGGKTGFFYITCPAILPFVNSSLKISLGLCWKAGVAGEVIAASGVSVGEQLYLAKISLDTGAMIAWTAVIVLLSVCFEKIILTGVNRFLVMQPACSVKPYEEHPGEIILCDVTKSYDKKQVLQGFSGQYDTDTRNVFDWPSGAGKTTLFRLIAGLEEADSGEIKAPDRGAFLFQEDRLVETATALKNVEMVTGDEQTAREALEELLDKDACRQPVSCLSGGMKRRVALARAMLAKADYVLLDEPFAGLDEENMRLASDFIRQHQRGRAVLVASHVKE